MYTLSLLAHKHVSFFLSSKWLRCLNFEPLWWSWYRHHLYVLLCSGYSLWTLSLIKLTLATRLKLFLHLVLWQIWLVIRCLKYLRL